MLYKISEYDPYEKTWTQVYSSRDRDEANKRYRELLKEKYPIILEYEED